MATFQRVDRSKYLELDWYCPRCYGRMFEINPTFYLRCRECGHQAHVDDCLTPFDVEELLRKDK
jgi:hypothetical protein